MHRFLLACSLLAVGCTASEGEVGTTPATEQDSGLSTDAGASDSRSDPTDTGSPAADTGSPAADTGSPAADTGSPATDTGTTATDTGSPATDTGAPIDSGTPGTGGVAALMSSSNWDAMFPNRNKLYTYAAFVEAAKAFPKFASEGSDEVRRREIAALLGNTAHETTGGWDTAPGGRYAWGLYFIEEVGCESGACTGYCDSTSTYKCAPGVTYHGRGPIQLSWNYNYGQFGAALGLDLLAKPQLVTSDGVVAWKTALWFWMTPQSPKPSAHDVMTGKWTPTTADVAAGRQPGFGMTVNIINGGLECGIVGDSRVKDRLGFYARFVTMLATTEGSNLDCEKMKPY